MTLLDATMDCGFNRLFQKGPNAFGTTESNKTSSLTLFTVHFVSLPPFFFFFSPKLYY